jgi:Arc/MetJ-type ribon-helix-helix transcriptional regulator
MKKKQLGRWKHIHFRVPPAMIADIEFLMKCGNFGSAGEYFRFLIRQELKGARISIVPPPKPK